MSDAHWGQPVLAHIGLPRAASNWLQAELFGRFDRGFFPLLPKTVSPALTARDRAKYLGKHLQRRRSEDLSQRGVFDPQAFQAQIRDWDWKHEGRPVLSNQHFSGSLHGDRIDVAAALRDIRAVFPHVLILIMIREQADALVSAHIKYLRRGGREGLNKYLSREENLIIFDYGEQVERLHGVFGKEAVLVFPYEVFASNRLAFLERLARFSQTEIPRDSVSDLPPVNVSTMYLARRFTRFLAARDSGRRRSSPSRAVCGLLGRATPLWLEERHRDQQRRVAVGALADRFARCNQTTAALLGLELGSLGYKVP